MLSNKFGFVLLLLSLIGQATLCGQNYTVRDIGLDSPLDIIDILEIEHGAILCGEIGNPGSLSGLLIWLDSLSGVQDVRTYSTGFETSFTKMEMSPNGHLWVVGSSGTISDTDGFVMELGAEKEPLYATTFGGTGEDSFTDILFEDTNKITLSGNSDSEGAGNTDIWVLKLDSSHSIISSNLYGGSSHEVSTGISLLSDGIYYMGGTKSFQAQGEDQLIFKLDHLDNVVWDFAGGGAGNDKIVEVLLRADGGLSFMGNSDESGLGKLKVIHLAPEGFVQGGLTISSTASLFASHFGSSSDGFWFSGMSSLGSNEVYQGYRVETDSIFWPTSTQVYNIGAAEGGRIIPYRSGTLCAGQEFETLLIGWSRDAIAYCDTIEMQIGTSILPLSILNPELQKTPFFPITNEVTLEVNQITPLLKGVSCSDCEEGLSSEFSYVLQDGILELGIFQEEWVGISWEINGEEWFNGDEVQYIVDSSGQYEVCLHLYGRCSEVINCQVLNLDLTPVNSELEEAKTITYYDPYSMHLTIGAPQQGGLTYRILNLRGQTVWQDRTQHSSESIIDCSHWSDGIYIIESESQSGLLSRKKLLIY